MPWITAAAVVGGSLLSGSMSSKASQRAAQTSADAQVEAARIAAEQSKFKPFGLTTNLGRSEFGLDAEGNLTSAGYTLDPRLQNLQTGLMGGYGGQLAQAQGLDTSALMAGGRNLMSLGNQYLSESPAAARERYINEQNALLSPINEQNLAGLRNRLYQTGRTGLATGGTSVGNMAATNPELAAYYNSLARQQAQLTANAELAAQQQQTFGQGLLGGGADITGKGFGLQTSAYGPLTTTLGISEAVEAQGQSPFTLGVNLGGRQTQANQLGAGLLNTASQNAALTQQRANQYSPGAAALAGVTNSPALQNWFSNQINPTYTQTSSNTNLMYDPYGQNPQYSPNASYTSNWYGGTGGMGD
jgi:hypothetical protein